MDKIDVMEFLMTYGWAIVVVLFAIGCLLYFGVVKFPSDSGDVWINQSNFTTENLTGSIGNYSFLVANITNMVEPTFGVIINDTPIFSMDGNATKFVIDSMVWKEVACTNDTLYKLNPDVNHTRCFVRWL